MYYKSETDRLKAESKRVVQEAITEAKETTVAKRRAKLEDERDELLNPHFARGPLKDAGALARIKVIDGLLAELNGEMLKRSAPPAEAPKRQLSHYPVPSRLDYTNLMRGASAQRPPPAGEPATFRHKRKSKRHRKVVKQQVAKTANARFYKLRDGGWAIFTPHKPNPRQEVPVTKASGDIQQVRVTVILGPQDGGFICLFENT